MDSWSQVELWVQSRGGNPTDSRLAALREVMLTAVVLGAAEVIGSSGISPRHTSLRRLGDPTRIADGFWDVVATARTPDTPVSEMNAAALAQSRLAITVQDLLDVFEMLSGRERQLLYSQREDEWIDEQFPSESDLADNGPSRVQRVLANPPGDPGDYMEALSQAKELDHIEHGDDREFVWPEPPEERDWDAVGELVQSLSSFAAAGLRLASENIKTPHSSLLEHLKDLGMDAWPAALIVQAVAQLDSTKHPHTIDFASEIALFAKAIETSLRSQIAPSSKDESLRGLGAYWRACLAAARTSGRRDLPSLPLLEGVNWEKLVVQPWLSTDLTPLRSYWLGAGLYYCAHYLRNGFIHQHAADERVAQAWRRFLIGEGAFLEYLHDSWAEEPGHVMRQELEAQQVISTGTAGVGVWMSEARSIVVRTTRSSWPENDAEIEAPYSGAEQDRPPPFDLGVEVEVAVEHDPKLPVPPTQDNEATNDIPSQPQCASDDTEVETFWSEYDMRAPFDAPGLVEPWPKVRLYARGARTFDQGADPMGQLSPEHSWLRWQGDPSELYIEWESSSTASGGERILLVPHRPPPPIYDEESNIGGEIEC